MIPSSSETNLAVQSILENIPEFVSSYTSLGEHHLDGEALELHKKAFLKFILSENCSREAFLELMSTLAVNDDILTEKQESLDTIVEKCRAFLQESSPSPGVTLFSDTEIIEKIVDIMNDIIHNSSFKSKKIELSIIVSAFLLHQLNRPFCIFENIKEDELKSSFSNKYKMCVLFADKYKNFFQRRGEILKAVAIYDDASRFQSKEGQIYLREWHDLNASIRQWKRLLENQ